MTTRTAKQIVEDAVSVDSAIASPPGWPEPMRKEAFHGLAGEFVATVLPTTEADPHGLLLQVLAACGNIVGRGPLVVADHAIHAAVLWVVLIGMTAKARKGTSWWCVRDLLSRVDPFWLSTRVTGGLSTGEGLVFQIRDPRRDKKKAKKGEEGDADEDGMVTVVVDQGVLDKRLVVLETEFAQPFKTMQREGNTLGIVLRNVWDHGTAGGLTKNDPSRVTNGHVTVIGHTTADECRSVVTDVQLANGLVNRHLFCCVTRSKLIADDPPDIDAELDRLARRFQRALHPATAMPFGRMERTEAFKALWRAVYPTLTADRPGRLGQATSRAEAHVLRLALVYAVLDQSEAIDEPHLRSALAVWDYCVASAAYVFGTSTGNPTADRILAGLRASDVGLTRTGIRELVGGNLTEEAIEHALDLLDRYGLGWMEIEADTGGRPAERWHATDRRENR